MSATPPFVFPAIDLRDGQVVRLSQGDYARETVYAADPSEQAEQFARAGASWLHVVDLDGARDGTIRHLEAIGAICRRVDPYGMRVEVGGGVRSQATIDKLLERGVFRVILGTAALEQWEWFEKLMGNPTYRGRIVLGLDARKGRLAVSGWEKQTKASAVEIAAQVSDWPLAAIVYTDIAVDGMMSGPNIEQTRRLARATHTPVVASGGVGTLDHLHALRELPLQGAIVGRALYEGAFTLEQAIEAFESERHTSPESAEPRP